MSENVGRPHGHIRVTRHDLTSLGSPNRRLQEHPRRPSSERAMSRDPRGHGRVRQLRHHGTDLEHLGGKVFTDIDGPLQPDLRNRVRWEEDRHRQSRHERADMGSSDGVSNEIRAI